MTKIEWATRTWNPFTGCTKVSPGCANCYAEKAVVRQRENPGYNSELPFTPTFHPNRLHGSTSPMHIKKPQNIFVCSMSDLFHEDFDEVSKKRVFRIMMEAHWHKYIILTKRPELMRVFTQENPSFIRADRMLFGVSVENGKYADRIESLIMCQVPFKFVSIEPILGWVSIPHNGIDWVIVGGESGTSARPVNPDWIRRIVYHCKSNGIPVFVKQLGAHWARESGTYNYSRKGGKPSYWPDDLQVRELPEILK